MSRSEGSTLYDVYIHVMEMYVCALDLYCAQRKITDCLSLLFYLVYSLYAFGSCARHNISALLPGGDALGVRRQKVTVKDSELVRNGRNGLSRQIMWDHKVLCFIESVSRQIL